LGSVTLAVVAARDSSDDLYRTHYARILRLGRFLLTDPHEAEETTQEVFLKLVREHRAQTPIRSWPAWLTRVAVNACQDRRRSAWWRWGREQQAEVRAAELPDRACTPEESLMDREAHEQLWQAVRALSPRQREVFAPGRLAPSRGGRGPIMTVQTATPVTTVAKRR